jgi:hypothetical protein
LFTRKNLLQSLSAQSGSNNDPAAKMNSGVYIAVVSAGGKSKTVKFAIEK